MPDLTSVCTYLLRLQDSICEALESTDASTRFERRELPGERGGLARPRVLSGGPVIEHAAVNFSHTDGLQLPPAASARHPNLAGAPYQAASLSLIVHPRNPYAPTSHANLRCFAATPAAGDAVWWFGGGFDLTPYYGFTEDAVQWHRCARAACAPHGAGVHAQLKRACDEYFYLPHRAEARGIGGLFFDDWTRGGFEASFALLRSVGDAYLGAYVPLLVRRKDTPYGARERDFQLYRRGRYVEFNLAYDHGTRFGLEAGGRTESILASLPPVAHWRYDWHAEPGSPEERLTRDFLPVRDWLAATP